MSTIQGTGSSGSDAWGAMRAQRQAKMFAKVDADGSGGVDKTELQTMLSDVSKKTGTDLSANIDDTFAKFDANSDGTLSSDELDQGMHDLMPPPSTMDFAQSRAAGSSDQSKELFSKIDANGDGSIDESELKAVTDQIKQDTGLDVADDMFAKLDGDGDGKITQSEFDAGQDQGPQGAGGPPPGGGGGHVRGGGAGGASGSSDSKTYDKLDTNKDGTVSEMERLVGELKEASAQVSGDGSDQSAASKNVAALAKQLYEQLAASWSNQASNDSSSTLSAVA